jgi:hypothetical protein
MIMKRHSFETVDDTPDGDTVCRVCGLEVLHRIHDYEPEYAVVDVEEFEVPGPPK